MFKGLSVIIAVAAVAGSCQVAAGQGAGLQGRRHIIGGVDVDAVSWASLCPSVQPIAASRGGRTCPKVHPADPGWRLNNPGLGVAVAPLWNCEMALAYYAELTTSRQGDWNACKQAFLGALKDRAPTGSPRQYDDMPFETWRGRYLAPWVVPVPGAK
jgi:hypothetical protein